MTTSVLLDPRTGIIRNLRQAPVPSHFPPSFTLLTSDLSDSTRFSPWATDPAGAGYALADPDAALGAALGEAAERYCGNLVPTGLLTCSAADLRAGGRQPLDLATLALFSPEQYAQERFPAVPFTPELVVDWVQGTGLGANAGSEVWVPASLVWPSYVTRAHGRPVTNPVIQAGLAAGPTEAFAVDSALRELLERDAMTLCWYGGQQIRRVAAPLWFRELAAGPEGALDVRLLSLETSFGRPVLAALVHDRVTDLLSLGTGVHDDPVSAAVKAYAEALQLHLVLAAYDDPDGAFARYATSPTSPLKPWRADRAYSKAYRADRRDVIDYACHLQLHLDPTVRSEFLTELEDRLDTDEVRLEDLLRHPTDLLGQFEQAGIRPMSVGLTTPDVAIAGLHAVRVIAPGLYSNAPLGLPFLGGRRFAEARHRSGRSSPRTPLPH